MSAARVLLALALLAFGLATSPALAAFPYTRAGGDPADYSDLYLASETPNDLSGDNNEFKYAASPDPANFLNNARPTELEGVRGGHVVDRDPGLPTAWQITTGRPDVTIAVLDSGIRWHDERAMGDLRLKTRLNREELPRPEGCASYDCNDDGVFNLADYEGDSRIDLDDPRRAGPPGVTNPQDLLIAFSDGTDADANGFVDDIVGWDFLDDDNDPYDDVDYGHGTGEAEGSSAEADNDGVVGSCPNCMVIHLRVGDSFIADVNRFAAAALYATDNGALVIQEALGTVNNSSLAREAVDYAYRHGVTVIASAADEAAQHNNWPSSLPGVILVNSATRSEVPAPDQSYLAFNGCTNFNAKITLAIASTSCSSDATGVGSGMAGLVYSAAYNAFEKGALDRHPGCTLTGDGPDADGDGPDPCVITPNEVRQLMASGTIGGAAQVDDVDFAGSPGPAGAEPSCSPAPLPGCTDPNTLMQAQVDLNRPLTLPASFSYPARSGHDQFYGYGRVNMRRAVEALVDDPARPEPSRVPPEVELASPAWYEQVDPELRSIEVRGEVFARGRPFTCRVLVAPGHYPNNAEAQSGDFRVVPSPGICDGQTEHSGELDGPLATVSIEALKAAFPIDANASDFAGRETGASGIQTSSGRPNTDPYGFVVKVEARTEQAGAALTGEDRRAAFLHRDQDMLDGFPLAITPRGEVAGSTPPSGDGASAGSAVPTADGESSPAFADLDGDNRAELVFATTDGFVHALRPDGSELPGWPVPGDLPGFVATHADSPAYESGAVSDDLGGAMLGSVAIGDANRDGVPEVYASDLEGKVYGWRADGKRVFEAEADPGFSGKPLEPFVSVRKGKTNRVQHGFISSPVLADLDGDDDGRQEVVIAGMDRHLYAWNDDGSPLDGFPVLVVDPEKVEEVDPVTHAVTFKPDSGAKMQGAIIDTPAIGDLDAGPDSGGASELPEIVVGTNEEYSAESDGGFNAAPPNATSLSLLDQARQAIEECGDPCDAADIPIEPGNSRLYALRAEGDRDGDPLPADAIQPGWPARLGIVLTELLPVVGEGVTGYPVIAPAACSRGGAETPKVAALANNGPAYVLDADGRSCYGRDREGKDIPLQTDFSVSPTQFDRPIIPAVGHPAFGDLGDGTPSLLAPAAGLFRALDAALSEYQRSQDFVAAWSVADGGQLRPGFPAPVNDLQFLTGPSIADIDGEPGEEVVAGTASKDLAALDSNGRPASDRWPKLSTDWTVANPLIGSYGTLDVDDGTRKVVIGLTRSGYVNAYETDAPACSPSSWPRFHHDNANSGDYGRDAVSPGVPFELAVAGDGTISFRAPGDDLLCGTAARYEVVTSRGPIDERSFDRAKLLAGALEPTAPGARQTFAPPAEAGRYLAIRAVDEQGNVGRVASITLRGR